MGRGWGYCDAMRFLHIRRGRFRHRRRPQRDGEGSDATLLTSHSCGTRRDPWRVGDLPRSPTPPDDHEGHDAGLDKGQDAEDGGTNGGRGVRFLQR